MSALVTSPGSSNGSPATSSSVFARLTGRRHPTPYAQHSSPLQPQQLDRDDATQPLERELSNGQDDSRIGRGRFGSPRSHHRRESSSLLSLSSVTELGNTVRRSVSVRSHRTNPSTSSSFRGIKSPSAGNLLTSALSRTTSPIESPDETPYQPLSTQVTPPRSRGRTSISIRTLSHKFKSTENLYRFSPTDALDTGLALDRSPPSAHPHPLPRTTTYSSMLLGVTPHVPGDRSLPSRPPLPTQPSSFGPRDVSAGPNGVPAPLQRTNTSSTTLAGGQNPVAVYQQIQETSAKRMATIDYLRRVHEGDIFYFSTLHYSQSNLAAMTSMQPHKLGRRATNYFVLGYSLPTILDMNSGSPLEYLKALSALLQEFETYQTLSGFDSSGSSLSRGRVAGMLKSGMNLGGRSGKGRRESIVTNDTRSISGSIAESQLSGSSGVGSNSGIGSGHLGISRSAGSEVSSPQDLSSPVIPTGLEFTHLMTPHLPFEPDFATTLATLCDTLIDTYGKLADLVSSPDACGPGVGDAFAKADKSIRKLLVSNVVREFEDTSRAGVRSEVAGLGKVVLGGLM